MSVTARTMPVSGWSSTSTLYTDAVPARCSTSRAVEALPCGSRSTTRTCAPCRARLAARLTAVVVLPTPPFWLAIVITRHEGGRGHSCSVPPSAANVAWAGLIVGAAWLPGPADCTPSDPGAPPDPGTFPGPGTLSGPTAVPGPAAPSGPAAPGTLPGPGTSLIRGTAPTG